MAEWITFLCSRASKSARRDKQALTGAAASQPQQLPTFPASRSHSPAGQENEEEKDQQGRRGLSFKCLRSLRYKIREDDWRRPQGPGLEPGSQVSSRGCWVPILRQGWLGVSSLPTRLSPAPHAGTRGKENRTGAAGDRAGLCQPPPPPGPGELGSVEVPVQEDFGESEAVKMRDVGY